MEMGNILMMDNKRGKLNAVMMFVLVVLGFMGIILMGLFVYGANLIDQTMLSLDIIIGNISFLEAYNETLGIGINTLLNSADNYGLGLLLGMVVLIIISSFMFQEKQKLWIVLEFFILIVAFILAVTIQGAYTNVINSSTELLDIYTINLIKSSTFILNLHIIVPIVWAFIVIISYGIFRKKEEFVPNIGA